MKKVRKIMVRSGAILGMILFFASGGVSQGEDGPRVSGTEGLTVVIEAENVRDQDVERPIRYDLPEGIEPTHLLDKADFMIKHDPETSKYFLEKNVAFAPGETKFFSIKVENVWEISENLVKLYMDNADGLQKSLKGTPQEEKADMLQKRIQKYGSEILASQKNARTMGEYISSGRNNQKRLNILMRDLKELQQMGEPEKKEEKVPQEEFLLSVLELAILISSFILIVTIVFFIIWYNRIK